jgi:branched-subunit amino acid aminotransferase/4-amino-4-deoxychorismate lyase
MNPVKSTAGVALQLFGMGEAGPQAVAIDATQGTVHDILERLPPGVYSALRTFGHSRFLMLDAHLDRTQRSLERLGWRHQLDRAALKRALHSTISAYPLEDARARFDVLREPATMGGVTSEVFFALSPHVPVPEEFQREGVRVELARHLRRVTPLIKTTDFVRARKPLPLNTREQFEGVMLDDQERFLECSSANIAFIRGTDLISAGDGVLEGITCKVLRKLAPTLGLRWVDERLPLHELGSVDEAFLCSSWRGVVPIVRIEETCVASGRVGPRVLALVAAYYACAEQEARPAID